MCLVRPLQLLTVVVLHDVFSLLLKPQRQHQGTMNLILLLLLTIIHNGLSMIAESNVKLAEKIFLKKLGLSQRPIVDKNMYIPPATMELYQSTLKQNMDSTNFPLSGLHIKSANTAKTYINKGSAPLNPKSNKYRLQFDLNPLRENERVKAAELRFTMRDTELQGEFIHVLIHDIIQPGIKGLSKPIFRLVDSKSINISNGSQPQVISFDVMPALERMSEENFANNHGMLVQCLAASEDRQTKLFDVFDFESIEKPLLMVFTDDGTNEKNASSSRTVGTESPRRDRRSADESPPPSSSPPSPHRKSKKKICQRYPLYVDFKEVGFSDWIQAPQGYDAYYCHGECTFPLANHMNASNHAVMQTLMNSVNPTAVTRSCCVPTKLSSQTLLYVDDEGKLVVKNYPDMVVEECGCR